MTYLVMTIMFIGGFLFGYLAGYGTDRRDSKNLYAVKPDRNNQLDRSSVGG